MTDDLRERISQALSDASPSRVVDAILAEIAKTHDLVLRDDREADEPKRRRYMPLTPAQRAALTMCRDAKPVAGNDSGWIDAARLIGTPQRRALVREGYLEPEHTDYVGPRGGMLYRVTDRGRAALFVLRAAPPVGAGEG